MTYTFDFSSFGAYAGLLARGAAVTLGLTALATLLGAALGVAGACASSAGPRVVRVPIAAYVELIRNTPFVVQLFFVFFGLPSLGVHIDEIQAAVLAMTVNLGAYATEIIRAGIDSVPRGQVLAAHALGLQQRQIFRHVVLPQALANVFPALVGQVLIVMLGSAVVSQISVPDLTYAASYIQSRNFRSFESYLIITATYLVLSILLRQLMNRLGARLFAGRAPRNDGTAGTRGTTGRTGAGWRARLASRNSTRALPTEPSR
jgi:polar amino acid transport system permease protein